MNGGAEIEIVKMLLQQGVNIDTRGKTLLNVVKDIRRQAHLNVVPKDRSDIVQLLLEKGVSSKLCEDVLLVIVGKGRASMETPRMLLEKHIGSGAQENALLMRQKEGGREL